LDRTNSTEETSEGSLGGKADSTTVRKSRDVSDIELGEVDGVGVGDGSRWDNVRVIGKVIDVRGFSNVDVDTPIVVDTLLRVQAGNNETLSLALPVERSRTSTSGRGVRNSIDGVILHGERRGGWDVGTSPRQTDRSLKRRVIHNDFQSHISVVSVQPEAGSSGSLLHSVESLGIVASQTVGRNRSRGSEDREDLGRLLTRSFNEITSGITVSTSTVVQWFGRVDATERDLGLSNEVLGILNGQGNNVEARRSVPNRVGLGGEQTTVGRSPSISERSVTTDKFRSERDRSLGSNQTAFGVLDVHNETNVTTNGRGDTRVVSTSGSVPTSSIQDDAVLLQVDGYISGGRVIEQEICGGCVVVGGIVGIVKEGILDIDL